MTNRSFIDLDMNVMFGKAHLHLINFNMYNLLERLYSKWLKDYSAVKAVEELRFKVLMHSAFYLTLDSLIVRHTPGRDIKTNLRGTSNKVSSQIRGHDHNRMSKIYLATKRIS